MGALSASRAPTGTGAAAPSSRRSAPQVEATMGASSPRLRVLGGAGTDPFLLLFASRFSGARVEWGRMRFKCM
uniref:Uncharacterized protein n=1 Tax=Setaria viridis TaxID=4556 RepID=A0A4U6VCK3_SETVI|nr:hypothetical protein SEVIR_3G240550v2 [Setaria viridis]